MTTSHPWLSSQTASATVVADDMHDRTRGADSIDEFRRGQTEVEADHFGTTPFDELADVVVERVPRRP